MNEQESLLAALYEEVQLHAYDTSSPSSYNAERAVVGSAQRNTNLIGA
jgi:tRNA nucleotidyltransferase (CCA-adding enzyme)